MKLHKRIILKLSGIILLCTGWIVWQNPMRESQLFFLPIAEAAIVPNPFTLPDASPDALIDKVVILSGLQKQIDQIGDKMLESIHQSPQKPDDPIIAQHIEKIVLDIYRPEFFNQQLRSTFKQDPDSDRLKTLIQMYNSPLMKRITEMENRDFILATFETFIEDIVRTPLPANRVRLLQDLEAVTRTTEFVTEIALGTKRALLMGVMNNGDNETMQILDTSIAALKAEMNDNTYQNVIIMMAYSYHELTDPELGEYIRFYETAEGEWFITHAVNAMIEAFRAGSLQAGKRIAALIGQKKSCAVTPTLQSAPLQADTTTTCTTEFVNSDTNAEMVVPVAADKKQIHTHSDQ